MLHSTPTHHTAAAAASSTFRISIFEDHGKKAHTLTQIDLKWFATFNKLKLKKNSDCTRIAHRLLFKISFLFFFHGKVNTRRKAFKFIKLSLNNLPKSLTGKFFIKKNEYLFFCYCCCRCCCYC